VTIEPTEGATRIVRRELYDAFLTRVLPKQAGVCTTCRQATANHANCDACSESLGVTGLEAAAVVPMALRPPSTQIRNMTFQYKDAAAVESARENAGVALSNFVGRFLIMHEACLQQAAEVAAFDVVTWVPGSQEKARAYDPVERMLAASTWASRAANRSRMTATLRETGRTSAGHAAHANRYRVTSDVTARSVLLVDDTWTRGAHALSGVRALLDAGADAVATTVVARHFDPGYSPITQVYYDEARRVAFNAKFCAVCDPRGPADPPLV
jgi:predicted amidophosphoribosyltransferase